MMMIQFALSIGAPAPIRSETVITPPPGDYSAAVTAFTRDRTVFDSGAARGQNAAGIPLSGTTDAPDGTQIMAEILDADTGALRLAGVAVATAAGGVWQGSYPDVPRHAEWLRPRVWVQGNPGAKTAGVHSFGVGHVFAFYEQSNWARIFDPSDLYESLLAPPPVIDPTAVQLFRAVRPGGGVERVEITDATPVSAQTVAFANAFARERPGEKLAIAAHVLPGTSPFEMINDGDPDRLWSDEAALHAEVTADGAEVGVVTSSWVAWDASEANPPRFLPVIAQAYIDGTPIALGAAVSVPTPGGSADYTLSHALTEFYDWDRTRFALIGAQGRGEGADKSGFITAADLDYEAYVDAWQALADNSAFGFFLPYGLELQGALRGVDDGAGSWRDTSHHSAEDADGLSRLAELGVLAILQSAGLADWTVPRFTNVAWEPSGAYADYWIAGADVTTERVRRGLPAIPDSFPHRTEVMGFSINGAAAQRAELQPDAGGSGRIGVRVYPNSGSFDFTTQIDYGRGQLPGFQQFPEDYQDGYHLNLPVADMGQTGMAAVPVQMRSAQTLGNALPAPQRFTTLHDPATYFTDPATVGGGVSAIRFKLHGAITATPVDQVLYTANRNNIEVVARAAGTLRITANAQSINVDAVMLYGQTQTIEVAYDAATGQVSAWVDGAQVLDTTVPVQTVLQSGRKIEFLSKNSGVNPAAGEFIDLSVWKNDLDGTGPAYKTITGTPATVNADAWKRGADAS